MTTPLRKPGRPAGLTAIALLNVASVIVYPFFIPSMLRDFPAWFVWAGALGLPFGLALAYGLWTMRPWAAPLFAVMSVVGLVLTFAFELLVRDASLVRAMIMTLAGAVIALFVWRYIRESISAAS